MHARCVEIVGKFTANVAAVAGKLRMCVVWVLWENSWLSLRQLPGSPLRVVLRLWENSPLTLRLLPVSFAHVRCCVGIVGKFIAIIAAVAGFPMRVVLRLWEISPLTLRLLPFAVCHACVVHCVGIFIAIVAAFAGLFI
jgi:hypothetical protein